MVFQASLLFISCLIFSLYSRIVESLPK